jgi:diadenosine tetraphosphate (Ap4A) HIT family hydrolase
MKGAQDPSNARTPEQRRIMEEVASRNECFLCVDSLVKESKRNGQSTPPFHKGKHWYVKHNDFPYEGTTLHVLIVPNRHVENIEELSVDEFSELQEIVRWVNKKFKVEGASLFVRYGNMSYTGATYTHMHFHLIRGVAKSDNTDGIKPKLGYKNK